MSLEGYGSVFAAGNRALREAMLQREKKEREDFLLRLKLQEMEREARKDEEEARRYDEKMRIDSEKEAYNRATAEREFSVSEEERKRKAKLEEQDRAGKRTKDMPAGTKMEQPQIEDAKKAGLAFLIANPSPGIPVMAGLPEAPGPVVAFEGGESGTFKGSPEYIEQVRQEGVKADLVNTQREDEQAHERNLTSQRLAVQQSEGAADRATRLAAATMGAEGGGKQRLGVQAQERVSGIESSLNILDRMEASLPEVVDKIGPLAGRVSEVNLKTPGTPVDPKFAEFAANTFTLTNAIIKAYTGAQMSEPEAKRIKSQIPLLTDKPEVWKAKAKATRENIIYLRSRVIAAAGGVDPEDDSLPGEAPAAGGSSFRVVGVRER